MSAIHGPQCGPHCRTERHGLGQILIRHCACGECHTELTGSVVTSTPGSPLTIAAGWGGVSEAANVAAESEKDQTALDAARRQAEEEAVAELRRELDEMDN